MSLPAHSPFAPLAPEQIVLETEHCVAFFDRYPVSRGHTLVVPKVVVVSLFDLEPPLQMAVWDCVRRAREILRERFRPDGFNIGLNDGRAAGQTVPHVHVHIIPRYAGDCADPRGGVRRIFPDRARYWERV